MNPVTELAKKLLINPQAKERIIICSQCSKFDVYTDKCRVCGCLMTVKTFIPIFHCPENKW
jgi:recombinational DNA repair protein RecR